MLKVHIRAEQVKGEFDFIVSRAVTTMDDFHKWVRNKVAKKQHHQLSNGILYLKGGDLTEELQNFQKATIYQLSNYFEESFYETKKVVHIPLKYKP
jgi:16S rRNA (guanine527-N7)-methyltransferase